jgi:hypothetical protein
VRRSRRQSLGVSVREISCRHNAARSSGLYSLGMPMVSYRYTRPRHRIVIVDSPGHRAPRPVSALKQHT